MTVYNTVVPVIANVDAPSPAAAEHALIQALERVGFDVYESHADAIKLNTFEAEYGTEPSITTALTPIPVVTDEPPRATSPG